MKIEVAKHIVSLAGLQGSSKANIRTLFLLLFSNLFAHTVYFHIRCNRNEDFTSKWVE